jgi:hypothetical protein
MKPSGIPAICAIALIASWFVPSSFAQTRTYTQGSMLYLDNGSVKVGLETKCGAAIQEISINGTNFINGFDCGRQIQASLYDGNAMYDACAGM